MTDDVTNVCRAEIELWIEATGHLMLACAMRLELPTHNKHVVMVTVEAMGISSSRLKKARAKGPFIIHYGNQVAALIPRINDWRMRQLGF